MIILDVSKLGVNFGYGQLFEDVSFSLNEGESISIVGPNGCGKSTLLKIIAGLEKADNGQVSIKKNAKVAYLDQTGSSVVDDRPVYDILKDAFTELREKEQQIARLQKKMESGIEGEEYNKVLEKYCRLVEEFSIAGGYDMETNINMVIEGLNIDKNLLNQSYNDLSGGEKTLVQLAKALLIKPDLILLDEPTNHLDIDRIEWLEDYIKSFKGASVIVSHDRYFLDKMSNKILDLDNGAGKVYSTNYTGFLEEKQRDFEKQMADYKDQQALIKKLEAEKKYFAERGMATNSSTLTGRAHTLQTKIDRLKKMAVSRPKEQKKLNVGFDEERKSSKRVITAKDLTVTTPEGRKIELIKTGKTVGFELDTNYELHKADNPCAYSARFQSIIGTGNISFLTNNEDKVYALSQIMFHNTGKKEWQFATKMLDTVTVFKLNVKEMSCKSHK